MLLIHTRCIKDSKGQHNLEKKSANVKLGLKSGFTAASFNQSNGFKQSHNLQANIAFSAVTVVVLFIGRN